MPLNLVIPDGRFDWICPDHHEQGHQITLQLQPAGLVSPEQILDMTPNFIADKILDQQPADYRRSDEICKKEWILAKDLSQMGIKNVLRDKMDQIRKGKALPKTDFTMVASKEIRSRLTAQV